MKAAYVRLMLINEAMILGHTEAKTPAKRKVAEGLVREGRLLKAGTMSGGGTWYRPTSAPTRRAEPNSPRVAFLSDGFGASEADDLGHVTDETFGRGNYGVLAFPHPNEKHCKDWVYVEVISANDPARRLYVGVQEQQIEFLVNRASAEVGAHEIPGGEKWIYCAAETGSWWVVTTQELETLCDFINDPDPEQRPAAYGRWCGNTSAIEITRIEVERLLESATENDPLWAETCKKALNQDGEALGAVATVILDQRAKRACAA